MSQILYLAVKAIVAVMAVVAVMAFSLKLLCRDGWYLVPDILKRGSSGVCALWSVPEPNQNKKE